MSSFDNAREKIASAARIWKFKLPLYVLSWLVAFAALSFGMVIAGIGETLDFWEARKSFDVMFYGAIGFGSGGAFAAMTWLKRIQHLCGL